MGHGVGGVTSYHVRMNTNPDPRLTKAFKAIASGVVALAAYLIGVIPAAGGFGDVSVVQWLGAVVFVAAGYGLTYAVPNPVTPPPAPPVVPE